MYIPHDEGRNNYEKKGMKKTRGTGREGRKKFKCCGILWVLKQANKKNFFIGTFDHFPPSTRSI